MIRRDALAPVREIAELGRDRTSAAGSTNGTIPRLRIGYGRAARIIDQLHLAGVMGPPDGSKPREVMVDIIGLDMIAPKD